MDFDYRFDDLPEYLNSHPAPPLKVLYERKTKDGEHQARAVKCDGRISIWTSGGIVYRAEHATQTIREDWSEETAATLINILVDSWDKGNWQIEECLFPHAPDEDLL